MMNIKNANKVVCQAFCLDDYNHVGKIVLGLIFTMLIVPTWLVCLCIKIDGNFPSEHKAANDE